MSAPERTSPLMHPSESNDIADQMLRAAARKRENPLTPSAMAAYAVVSIAASLRNISFSLYHIATKTRKENA